MSWIASDDRSKLPYQTIVICGDDAKTRKLIRGRNNFWEELKNWLSDSGRDTRWYWSDFDRFSIMHYGAASEPLPFSELWNYPSREQHPLSWQRRWITSRWDIMSWFARLSCQACPTYRDTCNYAPFGTLVEPSGLAGNTKTTLT